MSNQTMWLLWPMQKYKEFWQKIDKMSPKQKAMLPLRACRYLINLIGVRFLSDMKINWYSYSAGFAACLYLILATYTVIFYIYHNQFSTGLKSTCVLGICVPGLVIYVQALNSYRFRFRQILFFTVDHIYKDEMNDTKFDHLCNFYGTKSLKMTVLFMLFILVTTGQAMIGPAIEYHKTGVLVTFLALKLPFIDDNSILGFHLNVAIQTAITFFGTIGGLSTEMATCISNNTVLLCSEIVCFNCDEFGEYLKKRKNSTAETAAHLKQILQQIQDLDRFILEMKEVYYWRLFTAPVLIVYSVSISIFCQYVV